MNRRNRVLLLVFLVLAAAALAVEQPWRGDRFRRTEAQVRLLFPLLREKRQDIARVEIVSAGRSSTLERSGGTWVVRDKLDHPAHIGRLVALVDSLSALSTRDVVSTNPEKRRTYSVDDESGTRVRILDGSGTVLADLLGGGLRGQDVTPGGAAALEFYVRPHDRDEVVLAPEFRPPAVDPADWVHAPLCPAEAGDLQWLEREDRDGARGGGRGESWKLERVAGADESSEKPSSEKLEGWRMVEPEERPAASFAGDSFAYSFAHLEAADVADVLRDGERPGSDYGFSTDVFRAGDGKRVFEIHLGKLADDAHRYAWIPGSRYLYTIAEFQAGQLRQPVDKMLVED